MRAIIKGMVMSNKPERNNQGQEFRSLQVMQMNDDEAELVKVKDSNINNDTVGQEFNALCSLNVWQMGNRSGVSIKVVEHIKEKPAIQPVDKKTAVK